MSDINNTSVLEITSPIEGWLTKSETLLLYYLAQCVQGDGHTVEIGSYKGKSTIALALGLKKSGKRGLIWAIDPHQGIIKKGKQEKENTYNEFLKNIKKTGLETSIRPIVDTSAGAARRWKKPIRLLFIDGLHDYEHVQADIAYWSAWVVNTGVIAFHDAFCAEKEVWLAIKKYMFHRSDIVDIGTVSSILYVEFGKRTLKSMARVITKKIIINIANELNSWRIPWFFKLVIIHRFFRLLLWTPYIRMIYTKKNSKNSFL